MCTAVFNLSPQGKKGRQKNNAVHHDPAPSPSADPIRVGGASATKVGGASAGVMGGASSEGGGSSRSSKKKKRSKMQKVDPAALLGFTVNAGERPNMAGEIQSAKDAV